MDRLKVSVLYYEIRGEKPEHDYVVEQITEALNEGKHKVSLLSIYDSLPELIGKLQEQKPDIVFNLCETFAGKDALDTNIAAVLEALGYPFTGTGSLGLALRQDKAITKKLLRFYDVPCSNYAIFDSKDLEFTGRMRFPLFVKPLRGDASLCIDDYSLVTEYSKLMERAGQIQNELMVPALVEEYIEGREFYVSVLGNNPPQVLPLIEMDFSELPDGLPRIYGWQAKFDAASVHYDKTTAVVEKDLSPEVRNRVAAAGREAVHAVEAQDYARVDIRLSPEGIPYVMEVNANPYLEKTSEFAQAAQEAGISYSNLINRILEIAWERHLDTTPKKMTARETRAAIRRRAKSSVPSCVGVPEEVKPAESAEKKTVPPS